MATFEKFAYFQPKQPTKVGEATEKNTIIMQSAFFLAGDLCSLQNAKRCDSADQRALICAAIDAALPSAVLHRH